jgi:glycosyltransferase involved in cell wall biosynthesis
MLASSNRATALNESCSVIIPAHNEADYLTGCLDALLAQDLFSRTVEIIVVANGCTDATAEVAQNYLLAFQARGWVLKVLNLLEGNKTAALNAGDSAATGQIRVYLDADICCDPALLSSLCTALSRPEPTYATGRLELAQNRSGITRLYGEFWRNLPFVRGGAVGAGCYAVNAAGRRKWGKFPRIISDDSFVRLKFTPGERIEVPTPYYWPLAEGFTALVRVRRRQDIGMQELFQKFPELQRNESKKPVTLSIFTRALLRRPLSGLIYILVSLAVRSKSTTTGWARGR